MPAIQFYASTSLYSDVTVLICMQQNWTIWGQVAGQGGVGT